MPQQKPLDGKVLFTRIKGVDAIVARLHRPCDVVENNADSVVKALRENKPSEVYSIVLSYPPPGNVSLKHNTWLA